MIKPSKKVELFPGIWIAAIVIFLVGGRMFWVGANRPAHRAEIAVAFGSIGLFYGPVQTDSAGTRITYIQQGEKGLAVFLRDTATAHRQEIYDEYDPLLENVRVWPWSPDDAYFSYSGTNILAVCHADTGEIAEKFELGNEKVQDVTWLIPDEFVYFNDKNDLCSVQKQADGHWQLKRKSELASVGKISCLTVISTNSIAWLQNNVIWHMNLEDSLAVSNSQPSSIASTNPPINNLVLWLDTSTLSLREDGAPVTNLLDRSSSGNDAVVNGVSPTYNSPDHTNALNNKATIHFVSNHYLTNTAGLKTVNSLSITDAAPRSIFVIMRRDPHPPPGQDFVDPQMLVQSGVPGPNNTSFGIYDKSHSASLPTVGRWANDKTDNNIHELEAGTWNLLEAAYDGTTEFGYVNGILQGTKTNALKTENKEVQIGAQSFNNGRRYGGNKSDGDFAELLIYNANLSDDQRRQVQDYLASKWFGGKLPANVTVGTPEVLLDVKSVKGTSINEFSYSKEAGQFLISVENKGTTLWRFYPDENTPVQLLPAARNTLRQNLRWIGADKYAFISNTKSNSLITVAGLSGIKKTTLFMTGNATRFTTTPDGKQLFVTGIASNEPADEIWQYDVDSALAHNVVPYTDNPSPVIKRSDPVHGIATVNGRKLEYYLYRPIGVTNHDKKKHPLVIGNTVFVDAQYQQNPDGPLWAQALANCGAYVVIVDRRNWAGKEVAQWPENVMDIYDYLATNHTVNVDWNQVFLFASGSETPELNNLIIQRPELWKGAMFLNPDSLPDFSKLPRNKLAPKILIGIGELVGQAEEFKQYQENAIKYGMIVNYVEHKGATQLLQSKSAVLERTQAIVHFVFDD